MEKIVRWLIKDDDDKMYLEIAWAGYPGQNSEEPLESFDSEISRNYLEEERNKCLGNAQKLKYIDRELEKLRSTEDDDVTQNPHEFDGLTLDDNAILTSPSKSQIVIESDEEEESILLPSSQAVTHTVQTPPTSSKKSTSRKSDKKAKKDQTKYGF